MKVKKLLILLFIFFISLLPLKHIKVSNALSIWFPQNKKEYIKFIKFQKDFGNDDVIIVITEKNKDVKIKGIVKTERFRLKNKFIYIFQPVSYPEYEKMSEKIIKEIKEEFGNEALYGGISVIYDALNKETQKNTKIFVLISYFFILIFLSLLIRNFKKIMIVLFLITLNTSLVLSLLSVMGFSINIITSILPTLILIYSLQDIIHIYLRGKRNVIIPCFLTSLTTSIGFFVLLSSPIPAIKELGFFGGVSALIAFLTTFFLLEEGFKTKTVRKFKLITFPKTEYLMFILFIIFLPGFKNLKVDTNTIELLPRNNKIKKDSESIKNILGDYIPLIFSTDTLNMKSSSLIELKKNLKIQKIIQKKGKFYIFFAISPVSAKKLKEKINKIKGILSKYTNKNFEPEGYLPLYVHIIEYVTKTQLFGFLLSALSIFGLFFIFFGIKKGILSIISNLLPIIILFGVMGYLDIKISISTSIIAPILIGMVVDDSIHILYASKKSEDMEKILPSLFWTSLILFFGFFVFVFSSLKTIYYFGILSSLAVISAFIGDGIFLANFLKMRK